MDRPEAVRAIMQAMQASVEDETETFLAVVARAEIGAVLDYIAALEEENARLRELMKLAAEAMQRIEDDREQYP